MNKFNKLCESDITSIIQSILGSLEMGSEEDKSQCSCVQDDTIQPDSDIGDFGNSYSQTSNNISVSNTESGGIEVKSNDMNIKLSKEVFDAIVSFIKGDENGFVCSK